MMNKIVAFHVSCRKIIFKQTYQDIYSFPKMKVKGISNTSLFSSIKNYKHSLSKVKI